MQTNERPEMEQPRRIAVSVRPRTGVAVAAAVLVVVLGVLWATAPRSLPDFDAIDQVDQRKQAFFEFLAPIVAEENRRVLEARERLLRIVDEVEEGGSPGWLDRRWLAGLSARYEVEWDPRRPAENLDILARRVDAVPISLALVQAATESGWGRSRFAVEANNLFGHWCYRRGCGIVPNRRNAGAAHEVAAFDSVRQSVRRYLANLNTHDAYRPLREIRARLRESDEPVTAIALADGLTRYSERRDEYVDEIKTVIRVNQPFLREVGVSL